MTSLSVWQRTVAIFARPSAAWEGLASRGQWWFPLTVTTLCGATFAAVLHERALLPMISESWEKMVDSGQLTPDQLERMKAGMSGPASCPTGRAIRRRGACSTFLARQST